MLGPEVLAIDDLREDIIPELHERALDDPKGAALVMGQEVLDVLKQEGLWTLGLQDAADVKEQCALCFIRKAMRS